MSEPSILFEKRGSVALATLNRPQALNSFTRQMHRELWAVLDQVEADRGLRALVPLAVVEIGRASCRERVLYRV